MAQVDRVPPGFGTTQAKKVLAYQSSQETATVATVREASGRVPDMPPDYELYEEEHPEEDGEEEETVPEPSRTSRKPKRLRPEVPPGVREAIESRSRKKKGTSRRAKASREEVDDYEWPVAEPIRKAIKWVNRPIYKSDKKKRLKRWEVDRYDPIMWIIFLTSVVGWFFGAWLTMSGLNFTLAGIVAPIAFTVGQLIIKRVGFTIINTPPYLVMLFFDAYYNIIGLIQDRGYTFDFRPQDKVLWKSITANPQPIGLQDWCAIIISSGIIALMCEIGFDYWWRRFFAEKK